MQNCKLSFNEDSYTFNYNYVLRQYIKQISYNKVIICLDIG